MTSSIQQKDVTFQVCVVKLYNSQAQDIMDAKNPWGSKTAYKFVQEKCIQDKYKNITSSGKWSR